MIDRHKKTKEKADKVRFLAKSCLDNESIASFLGLKLEVLLHYYEKEIIQEKTEVVRQVAHTFIEETIKNKKDTKAMMFFLENIGGWKKPPKEKIQVDAGVDEQEAIEKLLQGCFNDKKE